MTLKQTSEQIARTTLDLYAAPHWSGTPHQRERVYQDAAQDIEAAIREMLVQIMGQPTHE